LLKGGEQLIAKVEELQETVVLNWLKTENGNDVAMARLIRRSNCLDVLRAESSEQNDKSELWLSKRLFSISETTATLPTITLEMDGGELSCEAALAFMDNWGEVISIVTGVAAVEQEIKIPKGACNFKLGFMLRGVGSRRIFKLSCHNIAIPGSKLSSGIRCLMVVRQYPSYQHLYKYPFVHRRVIGYRQLGVEVDVFSLDSVGELSAYEFEGITCLTGSLEELDAMISTGSYETVIVHGLSRHFWPALAHHLPTTRIIGWIHGSELHGIHRFARLGQSPDEQKNADKLHGKVLAFWQNLLKPIPKNLELVFVSKFSAKTAVKDIGFKRSDHQTHVIPNPIDTDLFTYLPKPVVQRFKILSIRPFDTTCYANDISVKVILALAEKPFFDQLDIRIIGDGCLFDKTLEPLLALTNVTIEKRFLRQYEIAQLYKKYGIFLVPSRMDTHGVSRDEAMASGLVPVTNAVSAIPEYTDNNCAILAATDDHQVMADGIEKIILEPDLFSKMSFAAAQKVRSLTSSDIVIPKEIALIDKPCMVQRGR